MYQMPYTQHPFPIYGTAPPQMKFDTHGSPSLIETNQPRCHPIPAGCHGCCNYGYVPAYFHPPQPQPFYYPSFSPMYPVHYTPPPYYPVDQPKYEFDKNHLTDHHCCGCPNSHCNTKLDPHVNLPQAKPNIEDIHNSSLVPTQPKSHPYFIEPEVKKSDQNSCVSKVEDKVKTTGKRNKDEIEGERNQFPIPIFWLPYKNALENQKEYDKGSSSVKGENSVIEKPKENEGRDGIESGLKETKKKNSNAKLIPVKHVVENGEERDKQIVKEKCDREIKPLENVAKTKLPPVCLRVEPLTKKKNGKSRSPSPKRNESKPSGSTQNDKNEVETAERVGKALEVVGGKNGVEAKRVECSKDIKENEKVVVNNHEPEVSNVLDKTGKEETNIPENKDIKEHEGEAKARKKLSEDEAAVVIQSAYRGLEVRRWDPLKKLKQINDIRVKVDEVRNRIEALKASSDSSSHDKQRLVIGETIMSLLLKLDTVQGLHPTVREIRKSVAKELVSLQEQLDSLGFKSSESRTLELMGDPMEEHAKAKVRHDNEVCEESKDVSSICKLKDGEEANEQQHITPSEIVSSVQLVSEHQEDLPNFKMMVTKTVDSEPFIDQLSVSDGESAFKEDMKDGQSSMEICKEPQDGDMKPAEVANNRETIAITDDESKDDLEDEIKRDMATEKDSVTENNQESEYSLPEDLKDEIKREMGTDSEECNCLDDFTKKPSSEDDYRGKQGHHMQVQGDQQAENTDSVFTTKADEPELLAEGSKPEECHGEEEALKPEETEPEMEPQSKYVLEIADTENDTSMEPPEDVKLNQEKQDEIGSDKKLDDMKASEMEPKESQESENKYVIEVAKAGNDKNMNMNQGKKDEIESDKKLEEENEKLREMVAKLVESGKEQLSVISSLSGRVKDLEMKLGKKKKPKTGRVRVRSSRVKASDHNTVKGVAANGNNK